MPGMVCAKTIESDQILIAQIFYRLGKGAERPAIKPDLILGKDHTWLHANTCPLCGFARSASPLCIVSAPLVRISKPYFLCSDPSFFCTHSAHWEKTITHIS